MTSVYIVLHYAEYRDHHQESSSHVNESLLETPLSNKQLLAESLHNLQPLVYCILYMSVPPTDLVLSLYIVLSGPLVQ